MKKSLKQILLVVAFCLFLAFPIHVTAQEEAPQPPQDETDQSTTVLPDSDPVEVQELEGTVIEILEEENRETNGYEIYYQKVKCEITKGEIKGEEITIEIETPIESKTREFKKGDRVKIAGYEGPDGKHIYTITDYIRRAGLTWLFIIFAVLATVVASKKGFFSLVSMGLTFLILIKLLLPMLLEGHNPVIVTALLSIIIIPLTFYLSHGFKRETTVAIMGTLAALIITGIMARVFIDMTYLRGFSSEDAFFLQNMEGKNFNLQGILLAGIIVGLIGILDDISIAQSAIVYQLAEENPNLNLETLFKKSMKLGKNHIASMVNTLILVYAGSSLPLLLLFANGDNEFSEIINSEIVATEIVHTLIGSIGLILTVPLTTVLACYFVTKRKSIKQNQEQKNLL